MPMQIAAHRGQWTSPSEKNSRQAFELALANGYGIETDLRDAGGQIVISHDMPKGGEMLLDEFLAMCARYPQSGPLALNIKADGMQALVQAALQKHQISNAFVFDMAVPDALGYLKHGIAAYTRASEYENPPSFLNQASGIWLDAFHGQWYSQADIEVWLDQGKQVCIVSPELHGREHLHLWQALRMTDLKHKICLCTDFPDQAKEYFHDED